MSFLEAPAPTTDCRCLCGSLIARRVDGGVELKCRRCKRLVFVPWDEDEPISDGTSPEAPAPSERASGRESRV
jgi:phage FluMu protein Com